LGGKKYDAETTDMLGKTVIVTGASSGIGQQTARILAKKGTLIHDWDAFK